MGKTGGFWDKANRKLVGDEKMDRLNAEAAARNEKIDARMDKFSAKLDAKIKASNEKMAKRVAEDKKMKENKKEIEDGMYADISASDLYDATLIAAAVRKYSISSSDKAGFIVTFQTPKVESFWDGKLSCFVLQVGDNARVTVSGSPNKGSTTGAFSPGAGKGRLVDMFSESASLGSFTTELRKFKEEIWRQVEIYPKTGSSKPLATEIKIDLINQIEQLKGLFESGALTAEEFAKAKKKLLGM
jgi:hypothetical protein